MVGRAHLGIAGAQLPAKAGCRCHFCRQSVAMSKRRKPPRAPSARPRKLSRPAAPARQTASAPTAPARPPPPATTRSTSAFIPVGGSLPRPTLPPVVDRGRGDPGRDLRIKRALAAAAPLLLLPLRLEYRVVDVATPLRVTAGVSRLFSSANAVTIPPITAPPPG